MRPPLIAKGKLFSGSYCGDKPGVTVVEIAHDHKGDWLGPFGDAQTNTMVAPSNAGVRQVPMRVLNHTSWKWPIKDFFSVDDDS